MIPAVPPVDVLETEGYSARKGRDRGGRTGSAPAARAASAAVAPAHAWTPLEPALVLLGPWQPKTQGGGSVPFVPNPDVIDLASALDLAPTVGEQVLVPSGGALAQLLRVGNLQEQTLDTDLLEIGHGRKGSRARARVPLWTRARRGTVDSRGSVDGRS